MRWYNKDKPHQMVTQTIDYLQDDGKEGIERDLEHLRLWGGSHSKHLGYSSFQQISRREERYSYNIIQQTVNTLTSKIGKRKPRVVAQPFGGSPATAREGEKLSKLLEGQFHSLDIYKTARDICRDALIYGTGVLKIARSENEVVAERVAPFEIFVDELDGRNGTPSEMFQVTPYSKELLISKYPHLKEEINSAAITQSKTYRKEVLADFIDIYEAWKLPTKDSPGRHVICIGTATLLDEEWNKTSFPFVFYRWLKRPVGFWGMGAAEQLRGIQIEIGKLLQKIQRSMHLMGSPYIVIDSKAKIESSHLNNRIGNIIRTNAADPKIVAPQTVHPEVFQHVERLYRRGFEIVGLSEMSATSKKPGGLTSGVALREFNDIETERFMEAGQSWNEFFLEIAEQVLEVIKDIQEDNDGDYSTDVAGKDFIESVNWKDIDLKDDQYKLRLFDVGFLPIRPEGRLAKVQELLQAGLIPQEAALELLDIPDLEAFEETATSRRKLARAVCNEILEMGAVISPEPTDDLEYVVSYGSNLYSKARLDNMMDAVERYPLQNIEALRVYVGAARELIKQSQPAPAPAPIPGMPGPGVPPVV